MPDKDLKKPVAPPKRPEPERPLKEKDLSEGSTEQTWMKKSASDDVDRLIADIKNQADKSGQGE